MAKAKKAKKRVSAIPKGYHTATAHLVVRDCNAAIDFYKKAFGAKERNRMPGPDGRLMHAEIKIGDSIVMMSDEMPEMGSKSPQTLGGCPGGIFLYVKNCDKLFAQATHAGATAQQPPADMFWGDRYAKVVDPYGFIWGIGTHIADLTPKQMKTAQEAWLAKQGSQQAA